MIKFSRYLKVSVVSVHGLSYVIFVRNNQELDLNRCLGIRFWMTKKKEYLDKKEEKLDLTIEDLKTDVKPTRRAGLTKVSANINT